METTPRSETCSREVSRKGLLQPCDAPAVGERMGEGGAYPVCKRHFNKAQQPPMPWRGVRIAREVPGTGEPLPSAVEHVRPCRDHVHYFDSGMIVLSCSKCLHHGGPLDECEEHRNA